MPVSCTVCHRAPPRSWKNVLCLGCMEEVATDFARWRGRPCRTRADLERARLMGLAPEARIAARRQLAIDVCGIALRGLVDKFPAIEAAVGEHGSARLALSFTIERWTPPANKREPNPTPRIRASVRVGKQNAIVELTSDQVALFLSS